MRKLLLGTTALAAAATLTANAALQMFLSLVVMSSSIYQEVQMITANDGTTMAHGDTDMVINLL